MSFGISIRDPTSNIRLILGRDDTGAVNSFKMVDIVGSKKITPRSYSGQDVTLTGDAFIAATQQLTSFKTTAESDLRVTLPSAAEAVASMINPTVGDVVELRFINNGPNSVLVSGPSGDYSGESITIPAVSSATILLILETSPLQPTFVMTT